MKTKEESEAGNYGEIIKSRSISLYTDEVLTSQQAAIEATKIAALFNMRNTAKVNMMAEIMIEEEWTLQRVKDASQYVLKANIYNTAEKGLEPGVILGFDKRMNLYTQEEVMQYNNGTGTHGFELRIIPGLSRLTPDGGRTEYWYTKQSEAAA